MGGTNGTTPVRPDPRRSASADAAALRHGFDDETTEFEPPPRFAAGGAAVPTRPSAHAEAAALRWREQHPSVPD
jgi:hypothetical protein